MDADINGRISELLRAQDKLREVRMEDRAKQQHEYRQMRNVKNNPWLESIRKTRREHPEMSYKDAILETQRTYVKKTKAELVRNLPYSERMALYALRQRIYEEEVRVKTLEAKCRTLEDTLSRVAPKTMAYLRKNKEESADEEDHAGSPDDDRQSSSCSSSSSSVSE